MSSAASPIHDVANAVPVPAGRHRTYLGQVAARTFARPGAKLGLLWIGVLVVCAVCAPLLANSLPLAVRIEGRWSSPLLRHLTAADVILFAGAAAVLVLALLPARWLGFGARVLIWLGMIVVSVPLCLWLVQPPRLVVYDQYRQLAAAGAIEAAYYTPIPFSPTDRLRDQPGMKNQPPSRTHWLGTEADGADVLSRMIHAARIALAVGFIATGIALVIGIIVGGIMGYFSGIVDLIGMRVVEIFAAIPTFFLLLSFVAFFPRNLYIMMVIIGVTGWVGYARFTRAEFLRLRQQDFVQAAVACGLPLRSILFRQMLPNGVAPVLVEASFGVAAAILYEATLSFLGLGLVDEPSWGQMLSAATTASGGFNWWVALYPGLAIFLTVFAYNLVGEALRDAIDPYTSRGG